jgi:hypothetical protein
MSASIESIADIDYNTLSDERLKDLEQMFKDQKSLLRRQMDNIDTELVGIRETLRRRKESGSLEAHFRNCFTRE